MRARALIPCFPAQHNDEDSVPAAAVGRCPPSQNALVSKVDTGPSRAVVPRMLRLLACLLPAPLQAHVGCSQPFAEDDCMLIQRLLSRQPEPPSIILGQQNLWGCLRAGNHQSRPHHAGSGPAARTYTAPSGRQRLMASGPGCCWGYRCIFQHPLA